MIRWLEMVIPHLKALHIAALTIWCAGILVIPLMLARHRPEIAQTAYSRVRRFSHFSYAMVVTPAGVIAIASGLILVFARQVFVPWMLMKLVSVGLLVGVHAWLGRTIVSMAESAGQHQPSHPGLIITLASLPMLAILFLVLAKPTLAGIEFPDWLTQPRGNYLPFEVPKR